MSTEAPALTKRDLQSDQEVRWCPGCGDYAILNSVQTVLPELGVPRENIVFVSGIGCAARFPYYMNTYGFHTIHGRAPALATGLKCSNPEMQVWVVTGDGDALSIGGNHLLHVLRRNVNVNILLFDNRIYGLTKGQYSPTSEFGKHTKSTPMGSIDRPVNPLAVALGSEATFVARSVDVYKDHLQDTLRAAAEHEGTSFVHILQNCVIFNDGAWSWVTEKSHREEHNIDLAAGEPILFGPDREKAVVLGGDDRLTPEVADVSEVDEDRLLVHDPTNENTALAWMLSHLEPPEFPVPIGVFRRIERPTYDGLLAGQVEQAIADQGPGDLNALLREGDTWEVK